MKTKNDEEFLEGCKAGKPVPIRIPEELMIDILAAAKELGMKPPEVIRQAASIGLRHLETVGFDLAGIVLAAAIAKEEPPIVAPKVVHLDPEIESRRLKAKATSKRQQKTALPASGSV